MGRRSDHSREEIRQMALQAADAILQKEGITGLSTRKVARSIGYTVGTLYLAFENLDDLILHLNAASLDELYDTLNSSVADCQQPDKCIHRLARAYYRFAHDRNAHWSLLYEYRSHSGFVIPDWFQQKVLRIFVLVEQCLAGFSLHQETAELRMAAQVLWSGIHGVCVLNLTDKLSVVSDVMVESLLEETVNNFVAGYLARQQ